MAAVSEKVVLLNGRMSEVHAMASDEVSSSRRVRQGSPPLRRIPICSDDRIWGGTPYKASVPTCLFVDGGYCQTPIPAVLDYISALWLIDVRILCLDKCPKTRSCMLGPHTKKPVTHTRSRLQHDCPRIRKLSRLLVLLTLAHILRLRLQRP